MTDDHRTNHEISDRSIDWSRQPVAARLRALADDELPPSEAADLRNELDAEAIARADSFERALRRSCAGCMSEGAAPAGLRERITASLEAACNQSETEEPASPEPQESDAPPIVISRTDRSFWTQGRAFMGVAAAVALAAVVWVLAPSGTTPSAPTDQFSGDAATLLATATQHVSSEHHGCTLDASHFENKMAGITAEPSEQSSVAYITEEIGDVPVKLALGQAGYTLKGVGGCHLPGPGKSVHLLYEPVHPGSLPISLFIQQASDAQRSTLAEGTVYSTGMDSPPFVRVWRESGAVYFMVTECPLSCQKAESAYGLPAKRVEL